ncbi:AMP-binding protein [Capillimicrobium parvum]|uniref:AMP-binding protein n=1 Tax=Capillimicrobium parvum TaxID=2884022 RepID=UPI00216AB5A3|nr:AMP-binding protein [Capillimicrobium parvum]
MPATFTPECRTTNELFERGALAQPDTPAFLYFGTQISRERAAGDARALAAALRGELGLRPGDRVAVMLQNIPQLPIAFRAVWLAGGIVTPVNPMNKRRELHHQLNDAGVRIAVCLESLYWTVDDVRGETPLEHIVTCSELDYLDDQPAALDGHERIDCPGGLPFIDLVERHAAAAHLTPVTPQPSDPALLTYTSGTTGLPKGAINTHANVAHNAELITRWFDLGAGDVTIALAPMFHITGIVCHLASSAYSGTPLLMLYRFEPGEMLRHIERWRATWSIGPLTAYIAMLNHPDFQSRDLSSLTKVAAGGAPVYPAVVEAWEAATGVYIHNAYGMTETSAPTHLTPFRAHAPVDADSGALSMGIPGPNVDSTIVSIDDGSELAPGEIGEIVSRGPMITPGYWNRPEETEKAIVDGWLHSGDVGKRDQDGWFYLVDRIKDMITVSGYKVWPRDVEDVLYQHPAVLEASVVGVPDDYRGETVRAYVALKPGAHATPDELIAHCRELLAVYKAPREVELVAEIPKTLTGKALRRELRDRARAEASSAGGFPDV